MTVRCMTKTILIVEDEARLAEILGEYLVRVRGFVPNVLRTGNAPSSCGGRPDPT